MASAVSSDEDVFGDRELDLPAPSAPQAEEEAVSCDEEEEEVARGLPLVPSPRRFRRLSSSSSGSSSMSPRPVEMPQETSSSPPPETPERPSSTPRPTSSRRRRRQERSGSDSSSSPEQRVRRRRRTAPLSVEGVARPRASPGLVPPSSPSAIVTVPGTSVGPMSAGISALYRTAFRRLLRLAPVPRSGRSGDEDPESEPDSEDGWFMTTVVTLEAYRTRPSSRAGRGQQRVAGLRVPDRLVGLLAGVEHPFSGDWAAIPHGFVSEWFPRRPDAGSEGCPACHEMDTRERACRERARDLWDEEVTRNARPEASGRGAFSWVDNTARPQIWVPLASHSCALGREVHFPVVFMSAQNMLCHLPGPEAFGVQLRVVLHFGIPSGLVLRWRSGGPVRMVFPLAGLLRRYWGRALMVSGEIALSGTSTGHRGGVEVHGTFSVSVSPRFPRLLRLFPPQVTATAYRGFRWDVTLLGASLRWLPPVRVTEDDGSFFPREVSNEALLEALTSSDNVLSSWVPDTRPEKQKGGAQQRVGQLPALG